MSSTTIFTDTSSTLKTSLQPTLDVIKNGFGAEITGLDFTNGVTEEAYNFIRDAVTKVGRLIPRNLIKAYS
jgi:alpha-ketoglutarate-dependent 2,4-dichlorophenoxyacetate dioxygenase